MNAIFNRSLCLIILCHTFLQLTSCQQKDDSILLGKWQSDQDWFVFKENKTYDSGKDIIKMVNGFKYSIDMEKKELNLYTDDANGTYYLKYIFKGNDTLSVRNMMNKSASMVDFIRVK